MNEETKNQPPNTTKPTPVETAEPVSEAPGSSKTISVKQEQGNRRRNFIIIAIVVVALLLIGLWYAMERSGRVDTGMFSWVEQTRLQNEVVATVNGEEISAYDLSVSEQQIAAAATAQGVDINDPDTQTSIREQAIEMLVNTELLRQEAEDRGLTAADTEVEARYEQLVTEVGGEEQLEQRMAEFGVNSSTLMRDIRNELVIQKLLDQVFADATVKVTDAEVQELYDTAGGVETGLPALAEVEPQIREQIMNTKEQDVINTFVEELRTKAQINLNF